MNEEQSPAQKITSSGQSDTGTPRLRNWTRIQPRPCAHCGKTFKPRQNTKQFCSRACGFAARAERMRRFHAENRGGGPAIETRTCPVCRKEFQCPAYVATEHCSVKCS